MAITKEKSDQILEIESGKMNASLDNARVRLMYFNFEQGTAAGDDKSEADLVSLPGRCKVVPTLSRVTYDALGTGKAADFGLRAYTKPDGTAVAEDADALAAALDMAVAGSKNLTVEGYVDVESKYNVNVFLKATALPASTVIKGYIAYLAD